MKQPNMKIVWRSLGAMAAFGLFALFFGYFDEDLTDLRRWSGCALIVGSMAIAWSAVRRLAEDWPRAKPQHNADLLFAQLAFGFAMLASAFFMGGRVSGALARLSEPLPKLGQLLGGPGDLPPQSTSSPSETRRTPR